MTAQDANDGLLYDTAGRNLYDADGRGAAAIPPATLSGQPALRNPDFGIA